MNYLTRFPRLLTLALVPMLASACDDDSPEGTTAAESASDTNETTDTDPTSDTQDASDTDQTSDTDGTTDTDGEPVVDLFACDVPVACEEIELHIDAEPPSAVDCVAHLLAGDVPGAFTYLETIGPDVHESHSVTVYDGAGKALRQTRFRECQDCDEATLEWEYFTPKICDVEIDMDAFEICQAEEYLCYEIWSFSNCVDAPEMVCEDLFTALGK